MNMLLSCDKCGGMLALVEFGLGCPRCLLSLASEPEAAYTVWSETLDNDTGEIASAIGCVDQNLHFIRNKTPSPLK